MPTNPTHKDDAPNKAEALRSQLLPFEESTADRRFNEGIRVAINVALTSSDSPVVGEDAKPIPMLLFCPKCGIQHIDEPDERTPEWDNPPHRSHLCHGCGCIWRPADVATVGVVRIETTGKADTWGESNSAALAKPTSTDTADRREAIAGDLRIRILTLLETLQADDFANADIGRAYADEAREIAASLIAGPPEEWDRRTVARCIQIVRERRDEFLDPEYAADQPMACGAAAFGGWLGAMPAPQARAVVASRSSRASYVSPAPAASIAIAKENRK